MFNLFSICVKISGGHPRVCLFFKLMFVLFTSDLGLKNALAFGNICNSSVQICLVSLHLFNNQSCINIYVSIDILLILYFIEF